MMTTKTHLKVLVCSVTVPKIYFVKHMYSDCLLGTIHFFKGMFNFTPIKLITFFFNFVLFSGNSNKVKGSFIK